MRDAMTTNPETYSFLGRVFTLIGDRYQCDRCRRTYDTIIQAAECDGPNHSQIRGGVTRRSTAIVLKVDDERERAMHRARQAKYRANRRCEPAPEADERRRRDRERAAEYRRVNADAVRARERERSARRRAEDPEYFREAVRQSNAKWTFTPTHGGIPKKKRGRPKKSENRPTP